MLSNPDLASYDVILINTSAGKDSRQERRPLRETRTGGGHPPVTAEQEATMMAELRADGITCEADLPWGAVIGGCVAWALVPEIDCWGPLDPQHVIPRSTAPELVADEANIVGCCRAHHRYIDDHPKRARELGLHGHAGGDLEELRLRRLRAAGGEPGLVRDALPTVEEDRERRHAPPVVLVLRARLAVATVTEVPVTIHDWSA